MVNRDSDDSSTHLEVKLLDHLSGWQLLVGYVSKISVSHRLTNCSDFDMGTTDM